MRLIITHIAALAAAAFLGACTSTTLDTSGAKITGPAPGSVIFLHPDGSGANMWQAARLVIAGPDGQMNWDQLPTMALYRGHLSDALAATSNAGGTIHAFGVKVRGASFGNDNGDPIRAASGFAGSV
ncbi:MAG: hypothetical protein K2V38_16620, partial [Gemmataceae bacterium]|nr:hypothetical protein [Gemmataceae bacterium]